MSLIFIGFTILASPAPLPVVESPPSLQQLEDAQVFLDGLGLILPMGYSPDMIREDSLPLRSPSPLSFLPQAEAPLWAPVHLPLPPITPEMGWVSQCSCFLCLC